MIKSYWFKGGFILVVILAIVGVAGIFFKPLQIVFLPGYIIPLGVAEYFFGGAIKYHLSLSDGIQLYNAVVFSAATYFLVGAISGWIYGKLKG